MEKVCNYEQAEKVAAFYFAHPERSNFLIPRNALFIWKHPWWFEVEGNEILVTVGLEQHRQIWRILGLLVKPDKRRLGYGKKAVEFILAQLPKGTSIKIVTIIPDFWSPFGFQIYDEPFKSGIVKMRYG